MGKIRDITFDIAKGIGIVLVVIGHYIPDNAPSWYIGFVSFVYHFHMPLFFMIAGFFYERSIKKVGYWRFVRSKFERLMFPYFILSWTIIGIKILVDGFMQVDHPVSIRALYRVFYLPEAGYFLWFVYVLFLLFCIAPVFKAGNRLVLLSLFSLGLAFWDTAPEYFCIEQFCLNSIFFVLGMWVARKSWIEQAIYRYSILWIVITIGFSIIYEFISDKFWIETLAVLLGITGSFMILGISKSLSRLTVSFVEWLKYIGTMSMTIYLFHTLFMGMVKSILTHILSGGNIIEFVFVTLFIVGTGIVCPILLYKWVWIKNKFTSRIFK